MQEQIPQNQEFSESDFRQYLAKYAAIALLPLLMFLFFIQPTSTCVGWLCSARRVVIGSSWVTSGKVSVSVVNGTYIGLNALMCFVMVYLAVSLYLALYQKADVVKPLIILYVALLLVFGANHLTAQTLRANQSNLLLSQSGLTQQNF